MISGLAASFRFSTRLQQMVHRFGRFIRRAGTFRRKFAPLSTNCWMLGDRRRPGISLDTWRPANLEKSIRRDRVPGFCGWLPEKDVRGLAYAIAKMRRTPGRHTKTCCP